MEEDDIIDELKNLRNDCRILNSDINRLESKIHHKEAKLKEILGESKEIRSLIEEMDNELKIIEMGDPSIFKSQIVKIESQIKMKKREFDDVMIEHQRLQEALLAKEYSLKKLDIFERAGMLVYSKRPKQIKISNLILLKRSIEEDLKKLIDEGSREDKISRKKAQMIRLMDIQA